MNVSKKERETLILKYLPFVKFVVGRISSKLPIDDSDKEDLINVGIIGLMSAIEKFDEGRNVRFETYAGIRIRGAVLDELRERDWVPRMVRSRDNEIAKAITALQKLLGRAPEDYEISEHMGMPIEEYFKLLDDSRCLSFISSEDLPKDYFDRYTYTDVVSAVEKGNVLDLITDKEFKNQLKEAIEMLPQKERLVLTLYYYEELTMKEIGRVLDLTESRVCQIHSQAIFRLKAAVKKMDA
jgi:RNA polymerase sigma factor for flagellar operon FliA